MYYATVGNLLDDVRAYYDDTNPTLYSDPTSRTNRLLVYYKRAVDEIWKSFRWPFRYKNDYSLALTNGIGSLPTDFLQIGDRGYVTDPNSSVNPYVECDYQEIVSMRNRPLAYQTFRYFAIGPGTTNNLMSLYTSNPADSKTLNVTYEKGPTVTPTTASQVDGPGYLHDCILANTLKHSMNSMNDGRDWETPYRVALSNAIKVGRQQRNRAQQMPLTTGKW